MFSDMRDWLSLAIGIVSLYVSLRTISTRRHCRRERCRSLKGWGIEWTTYEREDDNQS